MKGKGGGGTREKRISNDAKKKLVRKHEKKNESKKIGFGKTQNFRQCSRREVRWGLSNGIQKLLDHERNFKVFPGNLHFLFNEKDKPGFHKIK